MASVAFHPLAPIYEYKISELQSCLEKEDFKQIASDVYLFWLAFCKAAADRPGSSHFSVRIERGDLVVEGCCTGEIKAAVEEIRKFFQKSYESSESITIFPIPVHPKYYRVQELTKGNLLYYEDLGPKIATWSFISIKPALPKLAAMLKMSYENEYPRTVATFGSSGIDQYHCEAITIAPLV